MALETKWVRYGEKHQYRGYLAKIDQVKTNLPGVIVIQEIWGVDAHIQNVTERFAEAGYLAFAPDLYVQDGKRIEDLLDERVEEVKAFLDSLPHTIWNNPDERQKALDELEEGKKNRVAKTFERMFGGIQSSHYIDQLLATSNYLREECEYSRGEGVVSVGFCMGGALSGLLACRDPQLNGAVIFYGNAPSVNEINQINCPVYGFYGQLDKRITDQIPEFAECMKQNDKRFEFNIYPDTHHAFFNDTRSSYNVKAARDAYWKVLQFFGQAIH